jgi:hypothetical protein
MVSTADPLIKSVHPQYHILLLEILTTVFNCVKMITKKLLFSLNIKQMCFKYLPKLLFWPRCEIILFLSQRNKNNLKYDYTTSIIFIHPNRIFSFLLY